MNDKADNKSDEGEDNGPTAEDVMDRFQTADQIAVGRKPRTADDVYGPRADEEGDDGAQGGEEGEDGAEAADDKDHKDGSEDDKKAGSDDNDGAGDDGDEDKKRRGKKLTFQQRMDQVIARAKGAEREVAEKDEELSELRERLARLEGRKEADSDESLTDQRQTDNNQDDSGTLERPNPEDFDYGEVDPAYIEALSDFKTRERLQEWEQRQNQTVEDQRTAEAAEQKAQEYRQAVEELNERGSQKYEDFEEKVVVGGIEGKYPLSEQVGNMIFESDVGDEIAYHLASNPDEAKSLYEQDETAQARAFGRLEARFLEQSSDEEGEGSEKTPNIPKPKAPPPPKRQPRGSGGRFKPSAATRDFSQFKALVENE